MIWFKRMRRSPALLALLALTAALIALAVLAPVIAPNDPITPDYDNLLSGPSARYPLGTDQVGRCILSRLIWGGRSSLLLAVGAIAASAVLGIALGVIAGLCGGWADTVLTWLMNLTLSLPETVFVIAFVGLLGPGLGHTALAMILVGWCEYAATARTLTQSLRDRPFMDEARLSGIGAPGLLMKYVLPNVSPYLIVLITQDMGAKLLSLAGLSLLGLASQPPTPEWGFMLSEGRRYMQTAPWMILYPGLTIVLHVVVFSLLGDRLRDILQPEAGQGKKGEILS